MLHGCHPGDGTPTGEGSDREEIIVAPAAAGRSAAGLGHPYFCDAIAITRTEEGRDFIAMEYLKGRPFRRG